MSSDSVDSESKLILRLDRLRETREQRGLSQRQLARLCGFGTMAIYRYESGMSEPSASVLAIIARELSVSMDYLAGLTDVPNQRVYEELRPDETKLIEAYTVGDSTALFELVTDRLRLLATKKSSAED